MPAVAGAARAYAGGVSGEAGERVLQATAGHPSAYSDVNFHDLIPHKLQPWEEFKLSRNYPWLAPGDRRPQVSSATSHRRAGEARVHHRRGARAHHAEARFGRHRSRC